MRRNITVGIVGLGGDGVLTAGSLLLEAAGKLGYWGINQDYYTSQIRDGPVACKISLETRPIEFGYDTVDILVSFAWQKLFENDFLPGRETVLIYDEELPEKEKLLKGINSSFRINLRQISREKFGIRQPNILSLGLLGGLLNWPDKVFKDLIAEQFQNKGKTVIEKNIGALNHGIELSEELGSADFQMEDPLVACPKIIFTGNEAMAEGAIRAGCKFADRYAITPSTNLTDVLFPKIISAGGSVAQSEDEIAVVCKAMGASTLIKSLVGTSGPGLALMLEALGLATAMEIPLVVVDVQRAGPSTGLATQTEQSDLLTALWGSPGDSPRPVLAAHNIESCYRLTIEAFNIAEEFQTPVILLSDKWLGQSEIISSRDFIEKQYEIRERRRPSQSEGNYLRYEITDDFISAMADVGDEGFVYQTAGSTHNEKGQPRAATEIHQKMHEKRARKLLPLTKRDDLARVIGSGESDVGVLAWGSTGRVMETIIRRSNLESEVKLCVPELIFPLPDKVNDFTESVSKILFVEMNYSGQFYKYIKTAVDLPKDRSYYFRPGGLPFNQAEIEKWLKEALK